MTPHGLAGFVGVARFDSIENGAVRGDGPFDRAGVMNRRHATRAKEPTDWLENQWEQRVPRGLSQKSMKQDVLVDALLGSVRRRRHGRDRLFHRGDLLGVNPPGRQAGDLHFEDASELEQIGRDLAILLDQVNELIEELPLVVRQNPASTTMENLDEAACAEELDRLAHDITARSVLLS